MPKEDDEILKHHHRGKTMKIPFIINADMEIFLERIDTYH